MLRNDLGIGILLLLVGFNQVLSAPATVRLAATKTVHKVVKKGIQAELDGIVAVIPAGGPHNEMALRSSRHWRKVRHPAQCQALLCLALFPEHTRAVCLGQPLSLCMTHNA